ncbi:MAG: sulfate ABC transporter substrate-binding protein [Pirellulales bacterium]
MMTTRKASMAAAFATLGCLMGLVGCTSSASSNGANSSASKSVSILNVSYDPTREFYAEFNKSFAEQWQKDHNQSVTINMSNGGSGKQARAVMDGLEADVVTLALAYDIDLMAERTKLLDTAWQAKLPNNSSPYTSTIVFLVRRGNPKGIKDWDDLVKNDVSIITAHPKTSGGARWNYLSAWSYALNRELGGIANLSSVPAEKLAAAEQKAREFITELYKRVPVLDSGARGATNTFLQRGLGDVLITWENEAFISLKETTGASAEIVVPSISMLTEPPVALVDKFVAKHGTSEVAEGYLQHLYSPIGQQLAAKFYFRPSNSEGVPAELLANFPNLKLVRINDVFGSWQAAQKRHFDDGGLFDQIYSPSK